MFHRGSAPPKRLKTTGLKYEQVKVLQQLPPTKKRVVPSVIKFRSTSEAHLDILLRSLTSKNAWSINGLLRVRNGQYIHESNQ